MARVVYPSPRHDNQIKSLGRRGPNRAAYCEKVVLEWKTAAVGKKKRPHPGVKPGHRQQLQVAPDSKYRSGRKSLSSYRLLTLQRSWEPAGLISYTCRTVDAARYINNHISDTNSQFRDKPNNI